MEDDLEAWARAAVRRLLWRCCMTLADDWERMARELKRWVARR